MSWVSVSGFFEPGERRGEEAVNRLKQAYQEVASTAAGQIVIADMANHCGWNKVAPPGTPPDRLSEQNGMRAAFGRFFQFLAGTPGWVEAARIEAATDVEEGEF